MPFFKSARLELISTNATPINGVQWSVRLEDFTAPINTVGYFHATYSDLPMKTAQNVNHTLLDTTGIEGEQEWSGSFVGTSMIFSQEGSPWVLTRDPRFYFDDALSPQGHGTGTEEWGGGGDFWRRDDSPRLQRSATLFAGHPIGSFASQANNRYDLVNSLYRFLLPDAMPFGKNARIDWETPGNLERRKTVTYWYGLPAASIVLSDTLDVGNPASEQSHAYSSPDATDPVQITSKYDVSLLRATETERHTTTESEFTLTIDPDNHGVLLRRTLDWTYPNQEANVFIWDETAQEWRAGGVWYTPGSTVSIHDRDDDPETIEVSDRRFKEEELLLSKTLTRGKSELKLKVEFVPINRPLRPGDALAEQAWSEIRYAAYSYIMPYINIIADNDPAYALPWSEPFEALSQGALNAQHGWVAGAGAIVTNADAQSGSQSLSLFDVNALHTFAGAATNIWIEFWAKPIRNTLPGGISGNVSAAFYVNTNNNLVAYSNTTPIILTETVVSNGWNKFGVECDYVSKVWKLELNDTVVISNFAFYSSPESFSAIEFLSPASETAFIDSINLTQQFSQPDSDGDGLPDWWENTYYGGDTNANPLAMASNGVNSVWQAYIAGFSPIDPDAGFWVTNHAQGANHILQWNSVSGHVYSIYWTSNLLHSFQPLETNLPWAPALFADTTHSAAQEGFYKIEVGLE